VADVTIAEPGPEGEYLRMYGEVPGDVAAGVGVR